MPDSSVTDHELLEAQALSLNSPPSVLVVHDLCCAYPGQPAVLQTLDFRVRAGERVGVIGPNGAGKTTLFLTICGVLRPERGRVEVLGQPVPVGRFLPKVGLVFQNPNDQLFCPRVWDDVAFGPRNMGLPPAEVTERVEAALALTGVAALAERAPHHLSGGEKRMVAIAGVVAMRPDLIIYDEPSANLDIRSRRRLITFLTQASETLLIASHDLELIREVCDRVVVIDHGCLVADGPTDGVMSNQALMSAHGLETPYSLH